MFDNLLGIPLYWYYVLGIILLAIGVMLMLRSAQICMQSIKNVRAKDVTTGRCRRSLKDLGAYFVILIVYAVILFFIAIYTILYGFQNGWDTVSTFDLTLAVGYLVALGLMAIL